MLLFKKLNVENFKEIKSELNNSITDDDLKLRFWDKNWEWFKDNAPELYKFISKRQKLTVRLCRFYLTPSFDRLIPHVDGLKNNRSPIGLNIPIFGYENTKMNWYHCDNDNFNAGPFGFNKIEASRIINMKKLIKIESTTIDCPTFVRTDVAHEVINNNPTKRCVLSIRFYYNETVGQQFDDALDLSRL
jgi:hypothetical protein